MCMASFLFTHLLLRLTIYISFYILQMINQTIIFVDVKRIRDGVYDQQNWQNNADETFCLCIGWWMDGVIFVDLRRC